jgi:4-amino-4-deoxy-L-arabinose transferase-like glycosyltransferase
MNYLFLITTLVVVAGAIIIAGFTGFKLPDKGYDRLKWLTIRWSYIVVFLGLLVKTFNFPYGIETVTVVAGIGALMAGLLGVSAKNYYKLNGMFIEEPDDAVSDHYYSEEELEQIRAEMGGDEDEV